MCAEAVQCYCGTFILLSHGKERQCVKCHRENIMVGATIYSGSSWVYRQASKEWISRTEYEEEYQKKWKQFNYGREIET